MEWLLDPTAWVGLLTLVVLEIVLGIDNLVFIAILADRLPARERDRARIIGLSLALFMRLALLSAISWLTSLTRPFLALGPISLSGRDLILLLGGLFLIFKATLELHERLEGPAARDSGPRVHAGFAVVVTQIVVLDAVFSLDSVITAVGMVEQLSIMMIAVIIAIAIMLVASRPLTRFVNAHPTVVILCLAFLLMIGFSLVAEGMGFHVPKGYLYAAIGFSILIETFNQIARRNLLRFNAARPLRARTAEAVLALLGTRVQPVDDGAREADAGPADTADADAVFQEEERHMVSGVLTLVDRSVHSVMTPRGDISWINLEDDAAQICRILKEVPHSQFPVCRGSLDEIVGIGRARDLLADILTHGSIREASLRDPIVVPESIRMLALIDTLKHAHGQLVLVADEFGAIVGLVTAMDLFEAIAGEFPDEDEVPDILPEGENRWIVSGAADLHHLEQELEVRGLVGEDYSTLAGYLLTHFGKLPERGQVLEQAGLGLRFEVLEVSGRRIVSVLVERVSPPAEESGPD